MFEQKIGLVDPLIASIEPVGFTGADFFIDEVE